MKKIMLLFCFVLGGASLIAQVQRKVSETDKIDIASLNGEKQIDSGNSKISGHQNSFKELNLSREQRVKLKEMRQVNQSKREAINNDPTLTEVQKKEKLKDFKQAIIFDLKDILTSEQIENIKALRAEKIGKTKPGSKTIK